MVNINFQPDSSPVPSGYIKDIGAAYDDTRSYGWVREDSLSTATRTPLDIRPNSRDRNRAGIDQRLDTVMHMQFPSTASSSTAVRTPAAWEYALANGSYNVTVSVGDQPGTGGVYDSQHTINVEGVNAINRFQGTSSQEYRQATVQVNVLDGKLTVDAIGGTNTKINYLDISPASANGDLQIITPNAEIVQNRMVFSTINREVRAPKTLTLRNTGAGTLTITGLTFGDSQEKDNAVRSTDHQRAADFRLINAPTQPFTIAPNSSIDLSVQFAPQRVASISNSTTYTLNGENYASLTIISNDPDQQTSIVNLAGVNFTNYEGGNEPSVAEIARTFGWTQNIGTERIQLGGDKKLLGDEVYSPYWLRADTSKPVYLWPLAVTSGRGDNPHGGVRFEAKPGSGGNSGFLYQFAGRNNDDSPTGNEVLGSNNLSGGENQKLLPKILVNNANSIPTADAVDFVPSAAFALNNGDSWTDDTKNGSGQLHNWRMFPVRDAKGNLVPNTWFAIQDIGLNPDPSTGKNFDYNDHVYLLVNAKPESATLDPSIPSSTPGASSLVLGFNQTYPSSLTDKDGQTTGFTNTQRNKNDTFTTTTSYNSTLLDIDTSDLGTLKVTTTTGSNGGSDNTLVNGLQSTFNGRAGKFTISTQLIGPLNNLNAGVQQGGVMFGPDQDNYIKLVAVNQNGSPALQFYSEQKGVGTTIGPIVPISNPATLQSLELMLIADPQAGLVQAAYRAITPTSDTGMITLANSLTLKGGQLGRYFDTQSKAGIITTHKASSTPVTLNFDRFAVQSA